jgi:hypothetical protein
VTDLDLLDRGYASVMDQVVRTGQAPHYTELAATLSIGLSESKELVHELVARTPGWAHPGTDYLASFAPFNLQPTQYRVTIDGEPGWYAQCGFEALAIRWLVPGKRVGLSAPCLCCGESMTVEMLDDEIISADPDSIVGYTSAEVGGDAASRPFRWASNWDGYETAMSSSLKPLEEWASIFSNPFFQERSRLDYISWTQSEAGAAAFKTLRQSLPHRTSS